MVDALPAVAPLSAHQRAALLQRSDGVPLYVEELARSADAIAWDRERPSSLLPPGADIPPALRDSLMARLSSPGVDLEVAQIAATIGRDVDRRLLQEVRQVSDDEFQTKLANLLAVGILDRVDERRVRFRHELIRAAAYDTQLQSLRRLRHRRIAEVLPRVAVGSGDAGLVAFHLEHAGAHEEAIDAYIAAAQAGQALGAYREAMLQLTRALDLLERTDADQAPRELYVRQLRGFSAIMAGGYSSPLCREDHARCVELCEALGLAPALLPSLLANWSYYSATDIVKADRVTDAAERLVISSGLDIPIGAMGRGVTAFFAGRFAQARDLLEAFLAHPWSQPPGGPPPGWQLPNDPHVAAGAHLAAALAVSGESERAHEIARSALARAAGLPFPHGPFSAAYVHSQLAMILRLHGDVAGAADYGRRMFTAGEKHGFALFVVAGQIQEALSRVHDGEHDLIDPLTLAVRSWQELMAAEIWSPYLLTELAAAQALVGRGAQARASLERALECADHTGSHFFSSPTLRIRGELRLADGDRGGTDDLQAALELAREQGSPVFAALAETAFAVAAF
jgi:tetratricopeptide (TPR) repeat protein